MAQQSPNQFQIGDVEAALLAALGAAFDPVKARSLTGSDVNEMGDLVVDSPCVLLRFEQEDPDAQQDHLKVNYESAQSWLVIVAARSLRSVAAERAGAFEMLETAKDALAGLKLELAPGSRSGPIELGQVTLLQFDHNGTFYALAVSVPGTAQYTAKG